jgi:predicted hydrocarbon binding protein
MTQPPSGVSGTLTTLALASVREVSGVQYEKILKAAGLSRFITQAPPFTDETVSSLQEWSLLLGNIHSMLGEDLYRLFGRNLGTKLGQGVIATPWAAETAAQIQRLPPAAQMERVMGHLVEYWARQGVVFQRLPGPNGHRISPDACTACAGISGAHKPICTLYTTTISLVASHLYGHRLRVEEQECRAMGHPGCILHIDVI